MRMILCEEVLGRGDAHVVNGSWKSGEIGVEDLGSYILKTWAKVIRNQIFRWHNHVEFDAPNANVFMIHCTLKYDYIRSEQDFHIL